MCMLKPGILLLQRVSSVAVTCQQVVNFITIVITPSSHLAYTLLGNKLKLNNLFSGQVVLRFLS